MFVKPAPGRAARDPLTRTLLAEQGEEKPDTRFWRRRVRDKDVEVCDPPAGPEPEAEADHNAAPAVPDHKAAADAAGEH